MPGNCVQQKAGNDYLIANSAGNLNGHQKTVYDLRLRDDALAIFQESDSAVYRLWPAPRQIEPTKFRGAFSGVDAPVQNSIRQHFCA
jgi:hypothetical protein